MISFHPIPSHPIPAQPSPSHPIPSHPIPSHPIPSHPIPSHPIPSHPMPSPPPPPSFPHPPAQRLARELLKETESLMQFNVEWTGPRFIIPETPSSCRYLLASLASLSFTNSLIVQPQADSPEVMCYDDHLVFLMKALNVSHDGSCIGQAPDSRFGYAERGAENNGLMVCKAETRCSARLQMNGSWSTDSGLSLRDEIFFFFLLRTALKDSP